MDSRQPQGMSRNLVLFLTISFAILALHSYLNPTPPPPKPAAEANQGQAGDAANEPAAENKGADGAEASDQTSPVAEQPAAAETPEPAQQWLSLGSADPNDPYRMLVTLTNRGAAVARIELSSQRYRDLEYRGGYLGHLGAEEEEPAANNAEVGGAEFGVRVQVVGQGTPAAKAGIQVGDLIKSIQGVAVDGPRALDTELQKTKPGQTVSVDLERDGKPMTVSVTLARRPLEIVRPENAATVPDVLKPLYVGHPSPLSFLLTLKQVDGQKLPDFEETAPASGTTADWPRPKMTEELKGVHLREGNWEVVSHTNSEVVFRRVLSQWNLEIRKIYRLVEVPQGQADSPDAKAYHFDFQVELVNHGTQSHKVAYQLDGPNGLPLEGYWYASKVGTDGLRDFVISVKQGSPVLVGAATIAGGKVVKPYQGDPLTFIGVDAQYFSTVMIPQMERPEDMWFATSQPIRVGPASKEWAKLANSSFRVTSTEQTLKPEQTLSHAFQVFAGPKRPPLLAQYGLQNVINYGWFTWVAVAMSAILHFFYAVVHNYGIAIILLTVLVRGAMFPISIKQTAGAQKMQLIQPELKKIQEKFKGDREGLVRAQSELFRKHNYHPASGCLPLFIQLPIFIGLYRALMVDVELRQAPLFSEAIRWCSNLAAPDMFFRWKAWMPAFISESNSIFALGPYFNLLPIVAVVVMLWQQSKMMPPPADEQAAVQQKVMKYMMVVMGVMFFKVASGLCLYFIVSSLWGMAERQFLPKFAPKPAGGDTAATSETAASRAKDLASKWLSKESTNGDAAERRKKRSRPKR